MRKPATVAGLLLLTALAACQHDKVIEDVPQPPPEVETPQPPPEPPLEPVSNKGDFRVAIELLANGEAKLAKRHLQRELEQLPENRTRRTRKLLEEIDADPKTYLGQRFGNGSFSYRVRPGDSLSSIAGSFLKDPYSFYILGRFNQLERYHLVEVGQTIKIPGRRRAGTAPQRGTEGAVGETARTDTTTTTGAGTSSAGTDSGASSGTATTGATTTAGTTETTATGSTDASTGTVATTETQPQMSAAQTASELIKQRKYREAIAILDAAKNEPGNRGTLVDLYLETARQAESAGQLEAAKRDLEKAQALGTGNATVVERLKVIERKQWVDRLMRNAQDAKARGDPTAAVSFYNQVLAVDPDNAIAKNQSSALTRQLVTDLEREAESAQRRQELKKAKAAWEKISRLDPSNTRATLKIKDIERLMEKLEQ